MATHLVIDGNAFYEVDEECIKSMEEKTQKMKKRDERSRQREQSVPVCRRNTVPVSK